MYMLINLLIAETLGLWEDGNMKMNQSCDHRFNRLVQSTEAAIGE